MSSLDKEMVLLIPVQHTWGQGRCKAFSASGELERVMAEMAVWVNSVAVIRDGQEIFPLAPPAPNS